MQLQIAQMRKGMIKTKSNEQAILLISRKLFLFMIIYD